MFCRHRNCNDNGALLKVGENSSLISIAAQDEVNNKYLSISGSAVEFLRLHRRVEEMDEIAQEDAIP